MKDTNNILGYTLNAAEAVLASVQENEIVQWIEIGLAIVMAIVNICYTITKWYKAAKKDGKITDDEIIDAVDSVKKQVDESAEKIDNSIKKGK
jgi:hypothetical protein